ncbi:unnamed protein product [Rangifer tarandus platyrhynchus]|uniref:Uncharacterized protein n=1 Tax=Rangifer tarandus platyrhynchus TaxID=3082113 RepID=A0ABN8Z7E1_RANTA|nr:unnamed protein product [Rangifer tarandus platyrhynchus]
MSRARLGQDRVLWKHTAKPPNKVGGHEWRTSRDMAFKWRPEGLGRRWRECGKQKRVLGKDVRRGIHTGTPMVAQMVKNLPDYQKIRVRSLSQEDPLEKGMAAHPGILAWRIPQTEEPGRLQSMRPQRVRHD